MHPAQIAPRALAGVDVVVSVGNEPETNLPQFARATKRRLSPPKAEPPLEAGEALPWMEHHAAVPTRVRLVSSRSEHRRHIRKYAEKDNWAPAVAGTTQACGSTGGYAWIE